MGELTIWVFLLLLLLSAFFSGSESSLLSFDPGRFSSFRSRYSTRYPDRMRIIELFMNYPDRILMSLLLGNLIVNILISDTGYVVLENLVGSSLAARSEVNIPVLTLTLLIFGEIVPKVIAIRFPSGWSIHAAPGLSVWHRIAVYIARPAEMLSSFLLSWIPEQRKEETEDDLIELMMHARAKGFLDEHLEEFLKRTISFYHDDAYAAMVPVARVPRVNRAARVSAVRKAFQPAPGGTVPSIALCYSKKPQNPDGYIHIRKVFHAHISGKKTIRGSVDPLSRIPHSKPLSEVLTFFLTEHAEVVGITDESGEFTGIITLKDLLHQVMINSDESPQEDKEFYTKAGFGKFRIKGRFPLDEFNEQFGLRLQSSESETIAGYILERCDGFPDRDTVIRLDRRWQATDFIIQEGRLVQFKLRPRK